jgi:hypothetical protein
VEHIFSPTSRYEPEPYIRTTATNGDYDAKAETPAAGTATTAPGADENDYDPDDKHEYVNTETDKNIESEKSHSYCIDEKCSKQILDATNVGIKSIPNTRLKKQQTKNVKTD